MTATARRGLGEGSVYRGCHLARLPPGSGPSPRTPRPASEPPGTRHSPPPGTNLRLARLGAFDAALNAIRATAEADTARKAADLDLAGRHDTLAASYQQREQNLAQAMTDRQEWDHATTGMRRLAIAADAELRRRHPDRNIEPLRSAAPAPASNAERDVQLPETATRIRDVAAQHHSFREQPGHRRRMTPREDPDWAALGDTVPTWWAPRPDPILRPPTPEITPSATVLQLAAYHDIEPEPCG